jgi:hypothetical protein
MPASGRRNGRRTVMAGCRTREGGSPAGDRHDSVSQRPPAVAPALRCASGPSSDGLRGARRYSVTAKDAQCLLRGDPWAVPPADEKNDDRTAVADSRVEPSDLTCLARIARNGFCRYAPEERKFESRSISTPTLQGPASWDQVDQERQVLTPVAEHDWMLNARSGHQDVARCSGVRAHGGKRGGNHQR